MSTPTPFEEQVLDELRDLPPGKWPEVLDFIGYLKHRSGRRKSLHAKELTAHGLLQSGLVGLWADRSDIGDSLTFARDLRRRAERHRSHADDSA
jgi:hypothetical protein